MQEIIRNRAALLKIVPKQTKNLHPIRDRIEEKPLKFVPVTQKELVDSNIALQQIPLVFGTSKFKILLPVDQHVEIKTKETPKAEEENKEFQYKIKSKILSHSP